MKYHYNIYNKLVINKLEKIKLTCQFLRKRALRNDLNKINSSRKKRYNLKRPAAYFKY